MQQSTSKNFSAHDIFLSHSGAQKGFVRDLHQKLTSYGFSVFLDEDYCSLPLAENFPHHIFTAAYNCKLALVVLSHEYLSSKWPMLELAAFVRATSAVKILPLFFHLCPSDLKEKGNLEKWHREWISFANLDRRIDVLEWKKALECLYPLNGLVYLGATQEGESTYIQRIVDSIVYNTLAPRKRFDSSYVQGEARLREIILDKFEEMCKSRVHRCLEGPSSSTASSSSHTSITCMLGIYGLPGSGKSTLCRCLRDYFSPLYAGKSYYLEFPTSSTPSLRADRISDAFNLAKKAANIDEVLFSLKNHPHSRDSIFLAVDNICDELSEDVQRVLRCVVGPGSKVLLVAHTLDLLGPTLFGYQQYKKNWICSSMPMPSINEEEASNLLLETTGQGGELDRLGQRKKVLDVVRMCGFGQEMYLPLVVKRMGAMMVSYGTDVDAWAQDQERFWISFNNRDLKTYKEDVVQELILQSFKELKEEHQLMFLDLVFFRQDDPSLGGHWSILGIMHGKDMAAIRKMVRHLKRLCFIDRFYFGNPWRIYVHDVYVEFAKSIQKESFIHWSYLKMLPGDHAIRAVDLKLEEMTPQKPVRAMILDVESGCETVDLKNFSSLKSVVVRNCTSLVKIRITALASLVSLDITGFVELPQLECHDHGSCVSVQNIKRLNLQSRRRDRSDAAYNYNDWQQCSSIAPAYDLINLICMKVNNFVPAFMRMKQPANLGIVKHMTGLQVLHLKNTGIKNLDHLSSVNWPHLQELHVTEYFLEGFRLGHLPVLKRFVFYDGSRPLQTREQMNHLLVRALSPLDPPLPLRRDVQQMKKGKKTFILQGKDLLTRCPELQEVQIFSGFLENAQLMKPTWRGLQLLELTDLAVGKELPNLSSAEHTLQRLTVLFCKELEKLDLSGGRFLSLTNLHISGCHSLVEIKLGSQAVPSLEYLHVEDCSELCNLSGLEELKLLWCLHVACCSMLQESGPKCLSGLTCLIVLKLEQHPGAWKWQRALDYKSAGLEGLASLLHLSLKSAGRTAPINLANLTNLRSVNMQGMLWFEGLDSKYLEILTMKGMSSLESIEFSPLNCPELGSSRILFSTSDDKSNTSLYDEEKMQRAKKKMVCQESCPPCLPETLLLNISCPNLRSLNLSDLEHLTHLEGIDRLIHLSHLELRACSLLEELPSLHALQQLEVLHIIDCVKLKGVKGCDEMRRLREAEFCGCESMEQLPFKDIHALGCSHRLYELRFEGCRFARDRELLLEWAGVSRVLCRASLRQFAWAYLAYVVSADCRRDEMRKTKDEEEEEEEEEEGLLKRALSTCLLGKALEFAVDENGCIFFQSVYIEFPLLLGDIHGFSKISSDEVREWLLAGKDVSLVGPHQKIGVPLLLHFYDILARISEIIIKHNRDDMPSSSGQALPLLH